MITRAAVIVAVGSLVAQFACGSARVVRRTATGGEMALEGERSQAMKDARNKMQAHCQGPFTVIEEGETMIGTTMDMTSGGPTPEPVDLGNTAIVGGGETEWHVKYLCGDAPLVPDPAPCPVDCAAPAPSLDPSLGPAPAPSLDPSLGPAPAPSLDPAPAAPEQLPPLPPISG